MGSGFISWIHFRSFQRTIQISRGFQNLIGRNSKLQADPSGVLGKSTTANLTFSIQTFGANQTNDLAERSDTTKVITRPYPNSKDSQLKISDPNISRSVDCGGRLISASYHKSLMAIRS